jgi:hypothetical protein
MRISSLYVTNFLGIQHAEIQLRAPVALFAGQNAAGKSSLRDAVALAITADLGRVSLKKDAPALIREGADLAVCEVKNADGDEWRVTINRSGKIHDSQKGRDTDPVLAYVLDAQRFARLPLTERRAFLFGLMGVKMAQADIAARLKAKGCDDAKVQRVLPLLRSGFDAACTEAKTKATESKGSWRTVTGETYGSEKAKGWKAAVPPYDAEAAAKHATAAKHADVAIASWQQTIGRLQAEEQRRAGLRAKLPALQEHAAKVPRLEAKLQADQRGLSESEAALAQATAKAGAGPRVGLVHDLAHALRDTLFFVGADHQFRAAWAAPLAAYETEHGPIDALAVGDHGARSRLPELCGALELMQRAVANAKRDLAAAQDAHAQAKAIADELNETFDAAALQDARDQVEKLKAERAAAVAEGDKLKSIKALADAAEAKTKQAGQHAADVTAWDAIAQALSPDGIPADLLSEALGPVNARLAQSSADAAWPVVSIDSDMAITYGAGRPYALCSESERWRADAMLAEAIAHVSSARMLVLDRVDVLDLPGRSDLFAWLDVLAETGEIDSALLFATLKQPPAGLGERVQVEWIEAGVVGRQALREAA